MARRHKLRRLVQEKSSSALSKEDDVPGELQDRSFQRAVLISAVITARPRLNHLEMVEHMYKSTLQSISIFGNSAIDFVDLCKFPRTGLQLDSTIHRLPQDTPILRSHLKPRHSAKIHAICSDLVYARERYLPHPGTGRVFHCLYGFLLDKVWHCCTVSCVVHQASH